MERTDFPTPADSFGARVLINYGGGGGRTDAVLMGRTETGGMTAKNGHEHTCETSVRAPETRHTNGCLNTDEESVFLEKVPER